MDERMGMVMTKASSLTFQCNSHALTGVYLAKDGNVSMGTYAAGGRAVWKRSQTSPTNCVALVEMVNLPNQFVSNNPYFVVAETSWLVWYVGFVLPMPYHSNVPYAAATYF